MADAPGTCHLVGCPDKGQHPPHGIGTPTDFTPYDTARCLGTPVAYVHGVGRPLFAARCSIAGGPAWHYDFDLEVLTPTDMAAAVDRHRKHCTNRSPR